MTLASTCKSISHSNSKDSSTVYRSCVHCTLSLVAIYFLLISIPTVCGNMYSSNHRVATAVTSPPSLVKHPRALDNLISLPLRAGSQNPYDDDYNNNIYSDPRYNDNNYDYSDANTQQQQQAQPGYDYSRDPAISYSEADHYRDGINNNNDDYYYGQNGDTIDDNSYDGSFYDAIPGQDPAMTVQDRVNEWKTRQSTVNDLQSPRDEQGRIKLLTSVSQASRALVFFMLMWRNVHLYEVADTTANIANRSRGMLRLVTVVPLILLFVANLIGCITSFMVVPLSPKAKKRLKAILNLDKLLEIYLILVAVVRLTVWPPRANKPKEMFIANIFHSVFILLQCQMFTRLSWDYNGPNGGGGSKTDQDAAAQATASPLRAQPTGPSSADWYRGSYR